MLLLIFVIIFSIESITDASPGSNAGQQSFVTINSYNDCQGKDANNYTLVGQFTLGLDCQQVDVTGNRNNDRKLVQHVQNEGKVVSNLQRLSQAVFPNGAYQRQDKLYLVLDGPLEGKYLYESTTALDLVYLSKCSSVLGYSYIVSKSSQLLISDRVDLAVLISPTGALDAFKKGCTTVCTGQRVVV